MRAYFLLAAFFVAVFSSVFTRLEAKNNAGLAVLQERKSFEGAYVLENGLVGKAKYQYYLSGRDTVLHGAFSFFADFKDEVEEGVYNSISFVGSYNKGIKNGSWVFSSKKIRLTGDFKQDGYQIVYLTEGKEFVVKANFVSGVAEGSWGIVEQSIKNSVATDTLININATFSKGRMMGSVKGQYNGVNFSGEVSSDGFVDKRWVFVLPAIQNNTMEEHRIFEEGVNVNHYIVWGSDTINLEHIGLDTKVEEGETWETLMVNGNYFEIIETANLELSSLSLSDKLLTQFKDTSKALVNKSDRVFENVFTSFYRKDEMMFWKVLGGNISLKTVNVKLRKYSMDELTKVNLAATNKLIERANNIIEGVFENPNVEIGRLANQNLMFNYEVMKVYKSYLPKLTKLIQMYDRASFGYINRKEVFNYLLSKIDYPDSIKYYFRDQYYTQAYKFPSINLNEDRASVLMLKFLEQVVDDMSRIEEEIDKIVENKLSESKLKDKEKVLLRMKDSLFSLYENRNKKEDFNTYHEKSASKIKDFVQNRFEEYAALDEQGKIDAIGAMIYCIESLLKVYSIQSEIPRKLKRIDEAYTRTVWNPFTMTDMDERMKYRVYNAFESDLLPYFFSSIENFEVCEDILSKYENFNRIYNKMVELRNQDTKDIEKQLKGEHSPERILEIFNLQLNKVK